jgi:uncharacterized protein (DUF849 family)
MLIKAAINGGRAKAEHAALPVSHHEQALAVLECLAAGAGAVHLHVRSLRGAESLAGEDVALTLRAVRSAAPEAQVGVSTGAWIVTDPAARAEAVAAWTELPDFASVNFSEKGSIELARILMRKGIGVEAGLSCASDAEELLRSGLAASCLRVLLEPQEQEVWKARETVGEIEAVLDRAGIELPRLLHGTEATAWPIMEDAIARGYDIRIGFEDTLFLPDGTFAQTNAELVAEARRRARRGSDLTGLDADAQ